MQTLVKQRTIKVAQHLDQILYNSYVGLGSKFLKEQVDKQGGNIKQKEIAMANDPFGKLKEFKGRVWAGSLHINPKNLGKIKQQKKGLNDDILGVNQKSKQKGKTKTDILNEYFAEITTSKALSINKDV